MAGEDEILIIFKADIEDLKREVAGVSKDIKSGFDKADQAVKNTGKNINTVGDNVKGQISQSFKSLKNTIVAAFAVNSIVNFTGKLFEMQDALEQIDRRATVVFKDTLPEMQKEADKTAHSIGLTKSQFLEATSSISLFLQNTGFATEESNKMSTELLRVASNLSLVDAEGRDAKTIALDLAQSLQGGTKRLKEYGFNIKLAKGDMEELGDATEGSRNATDSKSTALEVMNKIMEQSKTIVGDLNNEMFKSEIAEREGEALLAERMDELARKSEGLKTLWLDIKIGLVEFFNAAAEGFPRMIHNLEYMIGLQERTAQEQAEFEATLSGLRQGYDDIAKDRQAYWEKELGGWMKVGTGIGIYELTLERMQNRQKKLSKMIQQAPLGERFNELNKESLMLQAEIVGIQKAWENLHAKTEEQAETVEKTVLTEEELKKIKEDQAKLEEKHNKELEDRLALLYKISAANEEIFKARGEQESGLISTFDKIAQENKTGLVGKQAGVSEEDRAAENQAFIDQRVAAAQLEIDSVGALQGAYDGLFDSMISGWLGAAESMGASQRQLVILEKTAALAKILMDYAVARFKISSQFAALLANPLTAATAPIFRTAALQSLNAGLVTNLATLAAVAIPQIAFASTASKFAKGVEFLHGAGTSTSDSIPAYLSKGERVVTAKKNSQYWDELSAIHNGYFENLINAKYVMPGIQAALHEASTGDKLAAGVIMQHWKGENIVMELYKNRLNDKQVAKELIEALKPKRISRRSW